MTTFKKTIAVSLAISQFGLTYAMAGPMPASTAATPEFTMLENVLALQGQNLPADIAQAQMKQIFSRYYSTAPVQGEQQRLEQAFVDLHLYTPAQAQAYVADAEAAAQRAQASNTSADAYSQAMMTEMEQLAATHPAGAQFSDSDPSLATEVECYGGSGLVLAGVLGLIWGASEYSDNPTCTTPTTGGEAIDPTTGTVDIVVIPTGPTTCTQGDYYPYRNEATNALIAGGAAVAIGGVLMYLSCDNVL